MNEKRFLGLTNAEPAKRYKSLVTEICDTEDVWMYVSPDGHVSVWAEKCFGEALHSPSELVHLDVHDFIDHLRGMAQDARISVFPTARDTCTVGRDELVNYICEELERVE